MKDTNKSNVKVFLLSKRAPFLLISASIVISILLAIIMNNSDESYLCSLYYAFQIIAAVFVVSGVVIAVRQYYLSLRDSKTQLEVLQVQRAIDLSEYYKDNILNYYPAMDYVFNKCGLSEITNSVRIEDMKDFDINECNRLFTATQISKLREIQNTKEFMQAVLEANEIYNLGLHMPGRVVPKGDLDTNKNSVTIQVDGTVVVRAFLTEVKNKALNNLEFFSMHFNHKVADDSVIYQSLHQTYLGFVRLLYYFIATLNEDATEKYYTNVIWLFNKWKSTKNTQVNEHSKLAQSAIVHGTRIGEQ